MSREQNDKRDFPKAKPSSWLLHLTAGKRTQSCFCLSEKDPKVICAHKHGVPEQNNVPFLSYYSMTTAPCTKVSVLKQNRQIIMSCWSKKMSEVCAEKQRFVSFGFAV